MKIYHVKPIDEDRSYSKLVAYCELCIMITRIMNRGWFTVRGKIPGYEQNKMRSVTLIWFCGMGTIVKYDIFEENINVNRLVTKKKCS